MQFSPEKNDIKLKITKVKYNINLHVMPFMDQNKT